MRTPLRCCSCGTAAERRRFALLQAAATLYAHTTPGKLPNGSPSDPDNDTQERIDASIFDATDILLGIVGAEPEAEKESAI